MIFALNTSLDRKFLRFRRIQRLTLASFGVTSPAEPLNPTQPPVQLVPTRER
jgi:hypothetical protein